MTESDQNYGPKLSITSTFLKFPEYISYKLLTDIGQYDIY